MSKIGDIKFPTLAGVTVLLLATVFGVVLANNKQVFMIGASEEILPKDVRISNIDHESFTVSWTTDKKTQGFVHLEKEGGEEIKTALTKTKDISRVHWISVDSLTPNTIYSFHIFSDGYKFDFNGIPWQVKTPQQTLPPPKSKIAAGKIITSGGSGVKGAIVYLTAGGGSLLSTISDENGRWLTPISKSRDISLEKFTPINENTLLQLSVHTSPSNTASAQIYALAATSTPPIIIGQSHDFKTLSPQGDSDPPEATIEIPTTDSVETALENTPITVDYPKQGNAVLTTKFLLTGSAPAGLDFTLQLEPLQSLYYIEAGDDNKWTWSPGERLPSGQYNALIQWIDEKGKDQETSHGFSVKTWQQN